MTEGAMVWLQEQDVTAGVTELFQSLYLIIDIASYSLKCITRWEGRDGVTITIFFQHTRDGHGQLGCVLL